MTDRRPVGRGQRSAQTVLRRLGILSVLVECKRAEFTYLRQLLELTDGNLSRHLTVLGEAGLVTLRKDTTGRRPRTWVSVTRQGAVAFRSELASLDEMVRAHRRSNANRSQGTRKPPSPVSEDTCTSKTRT